MLEKIKKHYNEIVFAVSIIVLAYVALVLAGYVEYTFSNSLLSTLIQYGLIAASAAVLLMLSMKKSLNKKNMIAPIVLFLLAFMVNRVYNICEGNSVVQNTAYLALYLGAMIVYIISLTNEKVLKAWYILLGIIGLYLVCSVISGNVYSTVCALIICCIAGSYLNIEGEKTNEEK